MHILRVNVTFYDAVNIIHDVITIRNPFPYTAKFMFVGVRNNETQQIKRWKINRIRTKRCRTSKISNSVERNDNFLAKARKLSILSTSLDIFDIRQHYIRILYIFYVQYKLKNSRTKRINPLPHNTAFWRSKEIQLWKTLWEKKRLLVTMFSAIYGTSFSF